jgi:hypothetical protein
MAVPIPQGTTFSYESPHMVVDGQYLALYPNRGSDVSRDGKRFLMMKAVASPLSTPSQLVIVQNWFEELNRLVLTRKPCQGHAPLGFSVRRG